MFGRRMCSALCRLCRLCLLFGFLKIGVTQGLTCIATQIGATTEYRTEDTDNILDAEPKGCQFSWSSNTNVIANHREKTAQVMNHSINHLFTSECFPNVQLKRDCLSEGRQIVATCKLTCSSPRVEEGGSPSPTSGAPTSPLTKSSPDPPPGNSFNWKLFVSVLVPVLLLLLLLGAFSVYLYRKRICRRSLWNRDWSFSKVNKDATLGA